MGPEAFSGVATRFGCSYGRTGRPLPSLPRSRGQQSNDGRAGDAGKHTLYPPAADFHVRPLVRNLPARLGRKGTDEAGDPMVLLLAITTDEAYFRGDHNVPYRSHCDL